MTSTTRPGFTATYGHAGCIGGHHHHEAAKVGTCDGCGNRVAKTHNGRVIEYAKRIACWADAHECRAEEAAAYQVIHATKVAEGEMVKGQTVTVVRGRKVPKGTTGEIRWIGEDGYGKTRVGIMTDDGMQFTAASNVEVTS